MTKPEKNPRIIKRAAKKKAHPNSLANLIPPSYPAFSKENQPTPLAKSVPKKATRREVFEAFFDKVSRDPKTGEEANRLAQVMMKAWNMFMADDEVKHGDFLNFYNFICDGYFGKQGEKLTIDNEPSSIIDLTSITQEQLISTVKYLVPMFEIDTLEEFCNWLEEYVNKKRAGEAVIINQS